MALMLEGNMFLRKDSYLVRTVEIAACLAVGLLIAGIAESYYERFEAQKLLAALPDIQVGFTTESRAKEIMKPFFRYSTLSTYPKGSADTFDQYFFRNRTLSLLHVSPATYVWITVDYQNGIVISKHAQAASDPRSSGSIYELVSNPPPTSVEQTDKGRTVDIGGGAPGPYFVIKVRDDITTPLARRKLDWQMDLSCLTWRKGCTDPRKTLYGAFLPVVASERSN